MDENVKDAMRTAGAAAAGATVGGITYAAIGGIGVAVGGTAVGLTLGPFIAIGAGVGAAGYGLVWLGKQLGDAGRPPSDGGK